MLFPLNNRQKEMLSVAESILLNFRMITRKECQQKQYSPSICLEKLGESD
jgi:hypothetical protein